MLWPHCCYKLVLARQEHVARLSVPRAPQPHQQEKQQGDASVAPGQSHRYRHSCHQRGRLRAAPNPTPTTDAPRAYPAHPARTQHIRHTQHIPGPTCMTRDTERGGMTVCWLGLFMAEPTLDSSLLVLTPAEEVKPDRGVGGRGGAF